MTTYDPSKVKFTFNGTEWYGISEDDLEFVEIKQWEDKMKIKEFVDVTINLEKQTDALGISNRIRVVTQCPSCSSAQECTSNDNGQFGAVSCEHCGIEYDASGNMCTLSKPSNHSNLLAGVQSTMESMAREKVDHLNKLYEEVNFDGSIRWPDNTKFVSSDPELSTHQTTHTAAFEFPNGEVIELPEPGGMWEVQNEHEWNHPQKYVTDTTRCYDLTLPDVEFRFQAGGVCNEEWYGIEHESGQFVLKEYARRLHDEQARVLWVKEWTMPNVTLHVDETMIPEKNPQFEGGWPVRHSNGPIKVND